MLKFPSGERPRIVDRVVVGGDLRGEPPPAVVIDELAFGSPLFGTRTQVPLATQGSLLVLNEDFAAGAVRLSVARQALRTPAGVFQDGQDVLEELPPGGGLLRIGGELVCYSDHDAGTGTVVIAPGGRALLGTIEEHHPAGSYANWVETVAATTLSGAVSAGGDTLPLVDTAGFPYSLQT
jgi:hypothetical protein